MYKKLLLLLACFALWGCGQTHNFVIQEQTVRDLNTGLVWAKNANMPGKPLPWKADDNVYAFIERLNKEGFGNYYDWRVPTREELEQMVSYATSMGFDKKDIRTWPYQRLRDLGFLDVHDYDYWTASRANASKFWIVNLGNGNFAVLDENASYMLWPVRGRQ
ncbi:MAG: DUF1566 domain-containing protein [Deltaproteobacteria bacterium]|nr:DUF1566 domain-containing protein [Deltaproteobacteria bacterium]